MNIYHVTWDEIERGGAIVKARSKAEAIRIAKSGDENHPDIELWEDRIAIDARNYKAKEEL